MWKKQVISLALLTMAAATQAWAGGSNGTGNGGGGEILFHSLASQIDDWLIKYRDDGTLATKLELGKAELSANDLVRAYEGALRDTPDVKSMPQDKLNDSCNAGDSGACLLLANPSRICANHGRDSQHMDGKNYIRCNATLFDQINGDVQFSIVFHELLGVAGIEKNGRSDIESYSQYPVSKHLMEFAVPRRVIRYELGDQPKVVGDYQVIPASELPAIAQAVYNATQAQGMYKRCSHEFVDEKDDEGRITISLSEEMYDIDPFFPQTGSGRIDKKGNLIFTNIHYKPIDSMMDSPADFSRPVRKTDLVVTLASNHKTIAQITVFRTEWSSVNHGTLDQPSLKSEWVMDYSYSCKGDGNFYGFWFRTRGPSI